MDVVVGGTDLDDLDGELVLRVGLEVVEHAVQDGRVDVAEARVGRRVRRRVAHRVARVRHLDESMAITSFVLDPHRVGVAEWAWSIRTVWAWRDSDVSVQYKTTVLDERMMALRPTGGISGAIGSGVADSSRVRTVS